MGVSILDTGSGRSLDWRGTERFALCSTAKVLGCAALLAEVDRGTRHLDQRIAFAASDLVTYSPVTERHVGSDGMTLAELCEAMITMSDNSASNLVVGSLGGPTAVTAFVRSRGDSLTRLDRVETALNEGAPGDPRDTTTPAAIASTLRRLVLGDGLSPASRGLLTAWLVANTTGAAKLRAGLRKGWRVGDKTGAGGHGTSNDVAVVWRPDGAPIVIAAYLTGAEHVPETARSAAIAEVGRIAAATAG